jgi:hypothetical protein
MHVNSTASYSLSYTANYGAAEQARSKAATKVTYKQIPQVSSTGQAKASSELVQKVGVRLNAKA